MSYASNSLQSPGFGHSLFSWLLIHTDHRALPNPNTTATAGMLLTGSSIGRSCESNNFAIVGHLEEEHISKENENDNSPERSSELWCLRKAPKAHIKLTLHPSKIKCQVPYGGGTGLRRGPGHHEIRYVWCSLKYPRFFFYGQYMYMVY